MTYPYKELVHDLKYWSTWDV